MRLGISTLLIVALASAGLAACGDSDTGSGGGGGAGGGVTSAGGNDAGTGGTDAGTGGTDAGTGGGTGDGECVTENVADPSDCDVDCDGAITNVDAGVTKCTITCTTDTDCSADGSIVCADGDTDSYCVPSCDGFECDGEDVCDQESLLCLPDQLSD